MQRGNAEGQAFNLYHLKTKLAQLDEGQDCNNQMDGSNAGQGSSILTIVQRFLALSSTTSCSRSPRPRALRVYSPA